MGMSVFKGGRRGRAGRWSTRTLSFALALGIGLAGCAGGTANGQGGGGFTLMSPEQEAKIGREEHPKVVKEFGGVYENDEVGGYVAMIGGRLVQNTPMAGQQFTFTVLNSPIVNAFALPGGYVYISRGLMALANSEAELAGVLGHEIGHVTERHTAKRYTRAVGAQIGGIAAQILGGVLGGEAGAQIAGQLAGIGGQLYVLGFSREQEYEADSVGILYIDSAGYDPFAQADFLDSMNRQSALGAQLSGEQYDPNQVDYFSTHPNTAERVRRASQQALQTGASENARPRNADGYLGFIDGMIYGDDPKEGIVNGRVFTHGELRFGFTAPEGWQLQNQPDAVIGKGPKGAVFKFDGGKGNGQSARQYLTGTLAPAAKVNLTNVREGTANGIPYATGITKGSQNGTPIVARLVAYRYSDTMMYHFLIVTPEQSTAALNAPIEAMIESFKRLSTSEASAVKPRRIRVVTVKSGDTIGSLASRMAFDKAKEERFRIINGIEDGQGVKAGQKVKIITF